MSQIPNDYLGPPTASQPTEVSRGRIRRPTEKVQAMFEDEQLEKQASEKQALAKARRREELMRKRDQANKAAEQRPAKATANIIADQAVQLPPDDAFTSRPVESIRVQDASISRAALTSQLVSRKRNVPPVPAFNPTPKEATSMSPAPALARFPTNHWQAPKDATGMIPQRVRTLTVAQSMKLQQLRGQTRTLDLKHTDRLGSSSGPGVTKDFVPEKQVVSRKRALQREATPYPLLGPNAEQSMFGPEADFRQGQKKRLRSSHVVILTDDDVDTEPVSESGNVKLEVLDSSSLGSLTISALAAAPTAAGLIKPAAKGRPKAGDYDIATRSILQTAIEIYCAILLTEDPFPSAVKELEWAKGAWTFACHHHGVQHEHDTNLLKLVTARSSHLRGQFKAKARPIVATSFGFESSADKNDREKNRALVSELKKDSTFNFRTRGASLDDHTGLYGNPAVQQVINEVLFKNKGDDALRWPKYYSPFPRVGFALTLTAIECAIDEWASGGRELISFKEDNYASLFSSHLASLNEFDKATTDYQLLPKLLKQVYTNGSLHAGVPVPTTTDSEPKTAIPKRAFMNALREYQQMESASTLRIDQVNEDNGEDDADDEGAEIEDLEYTIDNRYNEDLGQDTVIEGGEGSEQDDELDIEDEDDM